MPIQRHAQHHGLKPMPLAVTPSFGCVIVRKAITKALPSVKQDPTRLRGGRIAAARYFSSSKGVVYHGAEECSQTQHDGGIAE